MAFYDKNKKYLNKLYNVYSNIEEFKEFEKKFKDFSEENLVRMYTVKKANEVKDFQNNTDIDILDKAETLKCIGDFLDKTGKLDELIELQNSEIRRKLGKEFGITEEKNPFLLNKKEVLKNFNIETTLDKSEENINVKLAFWVNKFTKTLESVKRSNIKKIASDKNMNPDKLRENLNNIEDKIVVNNPNYYNQYNKFLNNEITKEEFEKTEEFKKMKKISLKSKYSTYELFDMASIDNNIAIGYMEKSFIIKDMALQKNNLELQSRGDYKLKGDFKVIDIKSKDKFNSIVSLHLKKTEVEILEKSKNSKIKKIESRNKKNIITTYLLNEYSDEKVKEIEKLVKTMGAYDDKINEILKNYTKILNIDVSKEEIKKNIDFRKKKEEIIKELEGKVNKNPKYKHENKKNNKNLNLDREDR